MRRAVSRFALVAVVCGWSWFGQSLPAYSQQDSIPADETAPGAEAGPNDSEPQPLIAPSQSTRADDPKMFQGPELPKGFTPPPEPPEAMKIEKPLMTKEEEQEKTIGRLRDHLNALKADSLVPDEERLIAELARYRVYALTIPEYRKQSEAKRRSLSDLRAQIRRELKRSATGRAGRELYLKELVKRAQDLFDGNLAVRINAVILLSELNQSEGSPRDNTQDTPYMPAMTPIVGVLQNPDQPDALKLVAVRSLRRFFEQGTPTGAQKMGAAEAMVAELKRNGIAPPYQYVLTQGLAATGVVRDIQNQNPFVPQALAEVMVDPTREWLVRCGAANALGHLPLDGAINIDLIAWEIVKLAHSMSQAHNKRPKAALWKECYWHLYLAFDGKDHRGARVGLTQRNPSNKFVRDGFQFLLSLNNHVLPNDKFAPIPAAVIDQMGEWIQSNEPQDKAVAPNQQPLAARVNPVDKVEVRAANIAQPIM